MPTPISIADQGFKLPVTITPVTTAQTVFTDAGGSAIVCQLSASPMPSPLNGDTGFQRVYQNIVFDIKAAGTFTTNQSATFQPKIRFGNSATTGSNSDVASATAATAAVASANWLVEAELMWDPTSTHLLGLFWGYVSGTITNQGVVTSTTITAANFFGSSATAPTGMHFVVECVFGALNTSGTATLTQFDIDPV